MFQCDITAIQPHHLVPAPCSHPRQNSKEIDLKSSEPIEGEMMRKG